MRNLFTCLLVLLASSFTVQAQQSRVSGKVTDAVSSEALPAVTVMVKGASTATQTDDSGNYSIEAAETDTLIFRSIGFTGQEVAIAGRTTVDVALQGEGTELEEVVVIGYGTAQKRDLTGSIAK